MRRIYFPLIPAFIAAVALTLGAVPVSAQQGHDHGAGAGCACCQKTGSAAENNAAALSAPSADVMEGDPIDHAAMDHVPAPNAAAAAGGCAMMQAAGTAGGSASCPMMAAKAATPAEDHSSHGAAAPDASSFAMPGKAGCGAMKTTANIVADPFAEDPSVGE